MNKTDLTVSLVKMRLMNASIRSGMSVGEAAIHAESFLKNNGLYGWTRKLKAAGVPESSIVVNVETYISLIIRDTLQKGVQLQDAESYEINVCAIDSIEQHRSQFFGGHAEYPRDIYDYIWYRLGIETPKLHGMTREQMGFDEDLVRSMTGKCVENFLSHVG